MILFWLREPKQKCYFEHLNSQLLFDVSQLLLEANYSGSYWDQFGITRSDVK